MLCDNGGCNGDCDVQKSLTRKLNFQTPFGDHLPIGMLRSFQPTIPGSIRYIPYYIGYKIIYATSIPSLLLVLPKLGDTLCGRVLHLGKITTISADLEVITLANHQFDP